VSPFSRREFLKSSLAVGTLTSVGTLSLHAATRTATDIVTLGKSGMKVTRLAFGTGSNNGHVQAELGQQEFTRLIHYAYDRGIRFFETAESYATPAMLGVALKGIPRESYQLMNKVTTDEGVDPRQRFDEMRSLMQTEYFDIMLLHWQHNPDWLARTGRWQDGILEAQSKKTIRTTGTTTIPPTGMRSWSTSSR
jgi:aryl-alcohol dehydrogenase-like predicted oxidoreductase